MKYQILFSGKSKKTIAKCCLLKLLPSMLGIKTALSSEKIFRAFLNSICLGQPEHFHGHSKAFFIVDTFYSSQ